MEVRNAEAFRILLLWSALISALRITAVVASTVSSSNNGSHQERDSADPCSKFTSCKSDILPRLRCGAPGTVSYCVPFP